MLGNLNLPNGKNIRLSESQNHRCAFCARSIDPYLLNNVCAIRIEPSKSRSYRNCVAACFRCAGDMQGRNALEFYEARGWEKVSKIKPKIQYPETKSLIAGFLVELAPEYNLSPDSIKVRGGHLYTPPEKAKNVAVSLLRAESLRATKISRVSAPGKGYKRCFLESQNHRCAYCGDRLETFLIEHPLFATWEHMIPARTQHPEAESFQNLIIACSACNSLRDKLDLEPMEYWEWLQNNSAVRNKLVSASLVPSKQLLMRISHS